MNEDKLLKQWEKDEKAFFAGWDFSYIKKRMKGEKLPWDYRSMAKKLVKKSKSVLDMATGGGEVFSSFAPFPKHAIAIEGYKPNVAVARKKLAPLGVKVIFANETKKLPLKTGEFDLVLNKHGGINKESAKEIFRILSKGGVFLTQQVEGTNLDDLMRVFGAKPKWPSNTLENLKKYLIKAGFKIKIAKKWSGKMTFKDVGAVVYFLKAIPWLVDNFSVKTYLPCLKKLQKKIDKDKKLAFSEKRFIILAEKK